MTPLGERIGPWAVIAGGSEGVGASFAMADGAVHWLSEFIDAKDNNAVFPLLGSMRDGQSADLFAGN